MDEQVDDVCQNNVLRRKRRGPIVVVAVGLLAVSSCDWLQAPTGDQTNGRPTVVVKRTSFATRAERRAFDGAPPVIPHEAFGISCTRCHTATGTQVPPAGMAPANPHLGSEQEGALSNCRQCHMIVRDDQVFKKNGFVGLMQTHSPAERAFPGAPPVIPHALSMRENCNSCHSGPSARQEIVCDHPERSNCRQCHVEHHFKGY